MKIALLRRRRRKKQKGGLLALHFALIGVLTLLLTLLLPVVLGVVGVYGVYAAYVNELPSAEEIGRRSVEVFETTRIYDRTGEHVLYEIIPPDGGRRTEIPLSRIPEHLRNATIAMEDRTFYTNPGGINVEGLLRAVWGLVRGEDAGGGSSIAQQLIRNVIMTPEESSERSYSRKIKELILSLELTRRYPGTEGRDQILEWYLNNIFYGHFAYGVEAAAQGYFGKSAEDLTLAEAAMLVPLGQSPVRNPIDQPAEAKRYQEIVLDQMFLQGYITAEEAYAAKQESISIAPPGFDIVAPHYVLYVRNELEQKFGSEAVYGGGLQVITAIDLEAQREVEEIARQHVATMGDVYDMHNAAVVVLDAKTAEIVAMVGSVDFGDKSIDGQINMAVSPRQPGSSFKPFTFATAFAQGYTPASMIMDVRTSFLSFSDPVAFEPENYDLRFHGPVTLRRALGCSYNIPAVALMEKVGIQNVLDTSHAMGITTLTDSHYGLALALGAGEVPLLDMTYAFSVFANGGAMLGERVPQDRYRVGFRQLDPVSFLRVSDSRGNLLYEYEEPQRQEVLRPEVAYLVTDVLSDNQARTPAFGSNSPMVLQDRPAAVKTGTTNDYFDGWTVGYTPQYVVGVWAGNTDHTEMREAPGVRSAAPIWHDVMTRLHEGLPVEAFARPEGIETVVVDAVSGKLPTEWSGQLMQELFISGMVPSEVDDVHQPYHICTASGKLATVHCPEEEVEEQVFLIFPSEANDWVRGQELAQPPQEYCDVHGPNLAEQPIAIGSPHMMQSVRGVIGITGNARPDGLHAYWLEVGEGLEPNDWVRIGGEHGEPVDGDVLEFWDTSGFNGLYTLRLSVATEAGIVDTLVPVIVDNEAPTVRIVSPKNGQTMSPGEDRGINIQVAAEDDVAMNRVEFYVDDQLAGYSTVAPYTLRWVVDEGGTFTIRAVAFDSAGNEAHSEPIQVNVQ